MMLWNSDDRPASRRSRLLATLFCGAACLALVSQQAAQADQSGGIEELTVTGTLIKVPNLKAESPVASVDQTEIKQEGATNIETLLNNLPQLTADYGTIGGGDGTATLNLRGLGATRTLILIDGRRIGPGDPGSAHGSAADVNFIPAALVSGVDILTGGASAVYGSDAVAGVVNFHLMRNLDGALFDETYTFAQHDQGNAFQSVLRASPYSVSIPGNQLDGFVRDTSGAAGTNFADGKGNITAYAEYRATSAIFGASRDWNACVSKTNSTQTGLTCGGSANSALGYFATNDGHVWSLNPNGSASFVPNQLPAMAFNFEPYQNQQSQDDRTSLGTLAHYQPSTWLDLYSEVMFMQDKSTQQGAPSGLFAGTGPTGNLTIPCNNKYLSAAQAPVICEDADGNALPIYQANGTPNVATLQMPGLRFTNYPRDYIYQHDDIRLVAGARGDLDGTWHYDISGGFWNSRITDALLHDVSFSRIQDSIDGCASGAAGCQQIDIFQYGGLTPDQFNYISSPTKVVGNSREYTANATVDGDLGQYGVISPLAANPVATAFGFAYRRDELTYTPSANLQDGDMLGSGGVNPAISGAESVLEYYGEILVPLVENQPWVKSANLNLALRHSDYTVANSNSAYSTNTYKITADYAPTDDVRFRGGYNRAARAPNVYDLFYPSTVGLDSNSYSDPCATATPSASFAACAKTGVTAAQYGRISDCPASQCGALTGGNLGLKPEEADTWAWGVNLTPSFLPGFSASVDYWDIQVNDYITNLTGPQVVNGCLGGVDPLCGLIHRAANGVIYGTQGYVIETNVNFGLQHDRGIDFDIGYHKSLADLGLGDAGTLSAKLSGTLNLDDTSVGTTRYNCVGLYGPTCTTPTFPWRHQARLTWVSPWNTDLSVNWRYFSGVKLDSNTAQPGLTNGVYDAVDAKIPAYSYFDVSGSFTYLEKYTVRIGVNNIFDKDPPILSQDSSGIGSGENTFGGIYDTLGRIFFANFNARF